MRAFARLQLPDGETHEVGPGDTIGRAWNAGVRIDDPRISEAHGLISLRGDALKLLALRGRFAVDGVQVAEVDLFPGLQLELARGFVVRVDAVELPVEVMAIEGVGLPRQVLVGVCSLFAKPRPSLRAGFHGGADAWLWSTGPAWQVRVADGAPSPLLAGDVIEVGDVRFAALAMPVVGARPGTTLGGGRLGDALHIHAWYDTAHIHHSGRTLALGGVAARIVSELVSMRGPVGWEVLAGEVWGRDEERDVLRNRFDVALNRLRRQLRNGGVRPDLVHMNAGCVELLLHPRDVIEDHT